MPTSHHIPKLISDTYTKYLNTKNESIKTLEENKLNIYMVLRMEVTF